MKKIRWKTLISCLAIVFAIAFAGSLFTKTGEWYESVKPPIAPPNYVFPIVWNILFFLISLSLYISWTNSDKSQKIKIFFVFGLNLALNLLWSILFFRFQSPFYSFYELILFWLSILLMIYTTYKINKTSSYLLVPYFLWVSFAGILNWLII